MSLKNYERTTHFLVKKGTLFLLVALIFAGCQKEAVHQDNESLLSQEQLIQDAKVQLKALMTQKGKLTNLIELKKHPEFRAVSADRLAQARMNKDFSKIENLLTTFHYENEFLEMAINPDDFECEPTFLQAHQIERIKDFTEDDFFFVRNYGIIPFFEAVFDELGDIDYFGTKGEFTSSLRKTFIDLKTFWDIPTNIQLSDMHGATFKDPPTVARFLMLLGFGFTDEEGNFTPITETEALEFAEFLKIIFGAPVFENYGHPILAFNAAAGIGPNGFQIIMGDGVLDLYAELGLRTTADKLIFAHEYGHQIQLANGILDFSVPRTPAETRKLELMADAYGAYFVAHGQGSFLQPALISRYIKTAFSVGDCFFDNPNHHGTPNQRARAATFGADLAKRRGLIDKKYSSAEFIQLFEEAYPQIIARDAE